MKLSEFVSGLLLSLLLLSLLLLSLLQINIEEVKAQDTTPPTYYVPDPAYTSDRNWTSSVISCLFNDDVNISKAFVRHNATGTWETIELIPIWKNSTACWANYTISIHNIPIGSVVAFNWTANDTSNNWIDGNSTNTYTFTVQESLIDYSENAVYIYDQPWVRMQKNILSVNLTKVVNDCANNNISYAIVFVGYWNATDPANPKINYYHNDSFYANVINAFHEKGIKVIAWAEDGGGGTMNITAGNRQNIYDKIVELMRKGFDGYNDDVEVWDGTHQDYIDYLNNCTEVMHKMGKLMTADVAYDWQQNTNMYLHMDFIVSMFYSFHSLFEDTAAGHLYWQENFGIYEGEHGKPASPMILAIMNFYGNKYPLPWQLNKCAEWMNIYTNRSLVGFCMWLYEYMGTRSDDWRQWNYWINRLTTSPAELHSITVASVPITDIPIIYQSKTYYTNATTCSFNITQTVNVPSSYAQEICHTLFGTTKHYGGGGYHVYTYTGGPYELTSSTTVGSVYFYACKEGHVKIAIYNSTIYDIPDWVGTNKHPHILQTQNDTGTYCAVGWNLIELPSVTLPAGDYFIAVKIDTDGMMCSYGDRTPAYYGRGQWIAAGYSVPFDSEFPQVEDATGTDVSSFIPTAPIEYILYNFAHWEDSSTSLTRTVFFHSNLTLIATYTQQALEGPTPPPTPPSTPPPEEVPTPTPSLSLFERLVQALQAVPLPVLTALLFLLIILLAARRKKR